MSSLDALSEQDRLNLALGRFVREFATTEANLRELVGFRANLSKEYQLALLTGARVDACMDYIRRMSRAHGWDKPSEYLDSTLTQLGYINTVRNLLLHHGISTAYKAKPSPMERVFYTSNMFSVIGDAPYRKFEVSAEILNAMTEDLHRIASIFRYEIGSVGKKEAMAEAIKLAKQPWLYKPPEQGGTRQQNQSKNRKPQPRQKSSRA